LGAETRHIAKIERGTGPRHWEAANKNKATINQRMRLAARGGTKEGAQLWRNVWGCVSQPYGSEKNEATKNIKH